MTQKISSNEKDNTIDHPKHYNTIPGIECIDVAEHFNFCIGNTIKYLFRAGQKEHNSRLQDLQKAKWYLDREIKNELKKQEKEKNS